MGTTTVRMREETRDKLRKISQETGQSMQMVLDQALDAYRREHFFAALDEAYARVWADPAARDEEMAERKLFEGTLADDLEDQ